MGNQPKSRYSSGQEWVKVQRRDFKWLMQNKNSQETVQMHVLTNMFEEQLKRETAIYSWRLVKKNSTNNVEILQMEHKRQEAETFCSFELCTQPNEQNHQLIAYTENIVKLYENNTKFRLTQRDQLKIFMQIIQGIYLLAQRFGFFGISKEMVGFNSKLVGKAWINENFACNYVQHKRQGLLKNQKEKWEEEILDNLVDICRLCTTVSQSSNCFSFIISEIKANRLTNFDLLRRYYSRYMGVDFKPQFVESQIHYHKDSSQNKRDSSSNQIQNSFKGVQSLKEVISSTKDCKDKPSQNKKYVYVPVVNIKKIYQVSQQERVMINNRFRQSDDRSVASSPANYKGSTTLRQNYVRVNRNTQSFMKEVPSHTYQAHSEIKPLDSIMQAPHSNKLEVNEGRRGVESVSSHDEILMIDSMIMVERESQHDLSFRKNAKVILDESIIIRGHSLQP